jgi:hypothetical protein
MSRGDKGKTLNLKGSHLSAAPPFWENESPSQPWLLPHFILIYNLQPGSPWFPFPFDLKTISRDLPSHQQKDTDSRTHNRPFSSKKIQPAPFPFDFSSSSGSLPPALYHSWAGHPWPQKKRQPPPEDQSLESSLFCSQAAAPLEEEKTKAFSSPQPRPDLTDRPSLSPAVLCCLNAG